MTQGTISSKRGRHYPHLQRENAYQWKGEVASYDAKHKEVYRLKGKASRCENREKQFLENAVGFQENMSGLIYQRFTKEIFLTTFSFVNLVICYSILLLKK